MAVTGLLLACSAPPSPVDFEDVTLASGLGQFQGMSHGVAWGDFDGDGIPDVYLTGHLNPPVLLRNLGNGQFEDVTQTMFDSRYLEGDYHGAAWADVTQNGRLDLIQLTGALEGLGEEPKRLFINQGDHFVDEAASWGVDNPAGRTRMPLWLDLDGDGKIDLIQGAEARFDDITPPFTFLQQGSRFQQALEALNFRSRSIPFCIVTQLINDGHAELVCRAAGQNITSQVFSTASVPARELDLLPATAFEDIVAGDFDNNGQIDLFLARRTPPGPVAFGRPADNHLIADIELREDKLASAQPGFSFRSSSPLQIELSLRQPRGLWSSASVRIGARGHTPDNLNFVLDPADPLTHGLPDSPGEQAELHIGFESPDLWHIRLTAPEYHATEGKRPRQHHVQIGIQTQAPVQSLTINGQLETSEQAPQRLFMNRGGKLIEESDKRGINTVPIAAMNVVAADFNNNMLLDLFILGSGDIGMHDSLLLINQGKGKFKAQPLPEAFSSLRRGVGDSVTTADFDNDGFVDLLIATGGSMGRSLGLPSSLGEYRLFRNTGNANNWLQIDLEGTRSNRDAIGARVDLRTDKITQTRIQDGGIHHRGQNHSRLHFGLAQHQKVDSIVVKWPSGIIQTLSDIPANQILRIIEPAQ